MINPEVQDVITSTIASAAGLPQDQTEAALQVLSGITKFARCYYNPDGTLASHAPTPANLRKFAPHRWNEQQQQQQQTEECSEKDAWFPWYKNPFTWGDKQEVSQPSQGHRHGHYGHGHGSEHDYDAQVGASHLASAAGYADNHAQHIAAQHASGLHGAGGQHISSSAAGHAQEQKAGLAQEHYSAYAKKGGVDLGFDYNLRFNRNKGLAAAKSHESAWTCAEQAASFFKKFSAFDVCAVFSSSKGQHTAADADVAHGFEGNTEGQHYWNVNH